MEKMFILIEGNEATHLISIQGQEGQIGKERITQSFTTKP
jgi:hypothetical protein